MNSPQWEEMNDEFIKLITGNSKRSKRIRELLTIRELCRDCDRHGEFYMVSRNVWRSAFRPEEKPTGKLCLNCLERRLGRRLERKEIGDGVGGWFDNRGRLRRSERNPVAASHHPG